MPTAGELIAQYKAVLQTYTSADATLSDGKCPAAALCQEGTVLYNLVLLILEMLDELEDGGYVS